MLLFLSLLLLMFCLSSFYLIVVTLYEPDPSMHATCIHILNYQAWLPGQPMWLKKAVYSGLAQPINLMK